MAANIVVPEVGESIVEARVARWMKNVGDVVALGDPLVELETDKVTQEVPAPVAGVLAEIVLDTDAEAVPGALLGRISTEGSLAKAGAQEAKPATLASEDKAPAGAPGPPTPLRGHSGVIRP